ncbi:hypothetical protein HZD82_26115, partial [Pantoea agglomerans]|nr:hypothetical protein [Pantoea agglomerans]
AIAQPLLDHQVAPFKALYSRIEMAKVEGLIEASKEDAAAAYCFAIHAAAHA